MLDFLLGALGVLAIMSSGVIIVAVVLWFSIVRHFWRHW